VITQQETDDGDDLWVTRERTRGKGTALAYKLGEVESEALDIKETQRHLIRVLGLDREVFHASIYFAQEALWRFAEAKDAKRMEILTRILGLSAIDGFLEKTKVATKKLQDTIDTLERELDQMIAEYQAMEALDFERDAQAWESTRTAALSARERELVAKQHELLQLPATDTASQLRADVTRLEQELLSPDTQSKALQDQVVEADKALYGWRMESGRAADHAAKLERDRMDARVGVGRSCRTCGQTITAEHSARVIAQIEQELPTAIIKRDEGMVAFKQWEQTVAERKSALQAHEQDKQRVRGLTQQALIDKREQLAQVERVKVLREAGEKVVAQISAEMAAMRAEQNPFYRKQTETVGRMVLLKEQGTAKRAEVDALKQRRALYDFWVEGFGPKGLKSYILDYRLNELTEAANVWVKLITGGTIWVRFETQTLGRSTKSLANKINLRVFRYNPDGKVVERNYASWSGGEKRRVAWAIDFGLSRLVASRAKYQYDLLILDEVFKNVDESGGEALVEMLQALREEKSTIMVIEQMPAFQDNFDNRITVRKENACSVILEGEDDGAAEAD
jgi:DNA repair exonuclease SbcCD ATPase subunit